MRVVVDTDLCEANEVCVRCCNEVFRVDEEAPVVILMDPVPEELGPEVERAVRSCPRQALTLQG